PVLLQRPGAGGLGLPPRRGDGRRLARGAGALGAGRGFRLPAGGLPAGYLRLPLHPELVGGQPPLLRLAVFLRAPVRGERGPHRAAPQPLPAAVAALPAARFAPVAAPPVAGAALGGGDPAGELGP